MKTVNIYLADDDHDDRELFKDALKEISIPTKVTEFSNGVDLMDALFSNKALPNAVFLDLHMPLMNGFECLTDIRSFPQFSRIKIFVYSTSYHEMEVKQLKEDGANHYLQKPNSFQLLKSLLFQSVSLIEHEQDNSDESPHFIFSALLIYLRDRFST